MTDRSLDPRRVIEELYTGACEELLRDYGVSARVDRSAAGGDRLPGESMVSVLGATGNGVNFLSTLHVQRSLLAALHPAAGQAATRAQLQDWCGELNNQLAGRVKNKLLGYGHAVLLGLPSLVSGENVATEDPVRATVSHFVHESPAGRMVLTLSLQLDEQFQLREQAGEASDDLAVMREGEISLF